MNNNPYIDKMKLEKRDYDKRIQYSLLLFLFVVLPFNGGLRLKSIEEQLHDFGRDGTTFFFLFTFTVVAVGLHSFWKSKQIQSRIHREEWREWEAKNRTEP